VIAILGILAALLIPSLIGSAEDARIKTDTANLQTLNSCTDYYGIAKVVTNGDIFDGITPDSARMQELVTKGYLKNTPTPKQKNVKFVWDIAGQKWNLSGSTGGSSSKFTSSSGVAVTGISLSSSSLIVSAPQNGGDNASPKTLIATISPSNATNQAVTWSSSNTAAATVSNGVVTFVNPGNTVITVTTADGSFTATCNVQTRW